MTRPRAVALLPVLVLGSCTQLQIASSGEIGCRPKDIQVTEKQHKWSTSSWVASCHGKQYQCSSVATAHAVDYSCAPLEGAEERPEHENKGAGHDFAADSDDENGSGDAEPEADVDKASDGESSGGKANAKPEAAPDEKDDESEDEDGDDGQAP